MYNVIIYNYVHSEICYAMYSFPDLFVELNTTHVHFTTPVLPTSGASRLATIFAADVPRSPGALTLNQHRSSAE